MAQLSGTILASRIVPSDSLDTYATHDADYGRGGYRSVADIAERDSITEPRRKLGMKVFVNDIQKEYQLLGGIENTNWTEIVSGSGETFDICTLDETSFINDTDMIVLCRDGVNKKISALNLKNYILGAIPENVVQYNNENITFNGGAVIYTEAPIPYNTVYNNDVPIQYLGKYITYN